jgi:hypothetical protein
LTDVPELKRLRVLVDTGRFPPDLGIWVLDRLDACTCSPSAPIDFAARDAKLRAAAALIPGSTWKKALVLGDALRRAPVQPPALARLIDEVLAIDPECRLGQRQMLRIIADD